MNGAMEDAMDVLLREHFDGPVPDDGFCQSVLDRLPARRRGKAWPMAAGALGGVLACWLSLWSAPVTHTGWRDWLSGELSASAISLFIAMMGMAILAMVWTVAEADDRSDASPRRMLG